VEQCNRIESPEINPHNYGHLIFDLLELTPKKDVLFIIGDWKAKVGSQGNISCKAGLDKGQKWYGPN